MMGEAMRGVVQGKAKRGRKNRNHDSLGKEVEGIGMNVHLGKTIKRTYSDIERSCDKAMKA